ncbi:MAG: choice-of-anchor B family protein [Phycisphaeraceae bacterium]|nr:choice-of-anchor B family protein [Phycisphaeraceae bacterium]MCW5762851.1 choice-of-anchor B family protein [Phycisphaeraceae bacterium]
MKTRFVSRAIVGCAAAALAASTLAHDDDIRKLMSLEPPVYGPVWRLGDPLPRGENFAATGITLLSWIPLNNFAGNQSSGNDCWGYVSPSGREYAIMGLRAGFGFVEITDPTNPVILTTIPGPTSLWHDVKVIGHIAYGVSEGGSGIQVMDMSNIDNGQVTLLRNQMTGGHTTTHNIVSNPDAGTLYLTGANIGNGGLVNLNLSDPTRPTIGNGWTNMYVHDACVVSYHEGPYAGREIAFCASGQNGGWNNTGLRIVDVTNKNNIFTVSTLLYSSPAYSHQIWVTPDKKYAYLNDELDEDNGLVPTTTTRIFDISNINSPFEVGTFTSNSPAIDHNLYVRDQFIFEANYTSGLRVFDASDPTSPVQIAFFDTYPGNDGRTFNGAWSSYPYFPSGTVIVSDINRGLFVLRVDAIDGERLQLAYVGDHPQTLNPNGGTQILATVTEVGATLIPSSVRLVIRNEQGVETTITGQPTGQPDEYRFITTALTCGQRYEYWVMAESTTTTFYFAPLTAPTRGYFALAVGDQTTPFHDTFETDLGWTTSGTATDGHWQRGVPVGGGNRGDPAADYDGSGQCYLTANRAGDSDIDNGWVRLTSPTMNASGGIAYINYARWFHNTFGANPQSDIMEVEVSNNGGSTWTMLEVVGPAGPEVSGGWIYKSLRINDTFPEPSDQFRIRFTAYDTGAGSVVEAAIDAVSLDVYTCQDPIPCEPDRNGDGSLDFFDIQHFLDAFSNHQPSADMNGDGQYNFFDVQIYLSIFSFGCP